MRHHAESHLLAALVILSFVGLIGYMAYENLHNSKTLVEMVWLTTPLGVAVGLIGKKYLEMEEKEQVEPPATTESFLASNTVILLVEDNEVIRKGVKAFLRRGNFRGELREATSCEEALKMLHEEAPYENQGLPDLIILDMIWGPGKMDGSALTRIIIEDPDLCGIDICALTSAEQNEFTSDVLEAICCFVQKGKMSVLINALVDCKNREVRLPTPKKVTISEKVMSISQKMKLLADD